MPRRAATVALAALVLVALVGCEVRTIRTEAGSIRFGGIADVEHLGAERTATWGCTLDEGGPFGEGLWADLPNGTASLPCEGHGHMAAAGGWAYVAQTVPAAGGALVVEVVRVGLADDTVGVVEPVFARPAATGSALGGEIDVTAGGEVLLGFQDGTGAWAIHRLTGAATSTVVPGTAGLGSTGFRATSDGGLVAIDGNRIVAVSAAGTRTVVAGTGAWGFSGDGGPAVAATFAEPKDLVHTPDGYLLVADSGNGRIRKVVPGGAVMTVVGGGTSDAEGASFPDAVLRWPVAVASGVLEGCLWYADGAPARGPDDQNPGRLRFAGGRECPGHPDDD